jgi:glycosyltransferase involved in cell wall biosynthesis
MPEGGPSSFRQTPNLGQSVAGLRVIIVLGPLELGGSERQALLFARYLKEAKRAEVEVWGTMGQPGRVAALCDEYGIPWRIVSEPWVSGQAQRLRALKKFARQLRRAQPDILLPYMEMPNLVCALVWRWTGAELCIWNQRDDGIALIPTRYQRLAVRLTPRFISNSSHGAQHLITRGVPPERIKVIHNGVELASAEASRDTWRRKLGLCDGSFVAMMVANLTQFKDHATLLNAWRLVRNELEANERSASLLLAGRFDEMHQPLEALTQELGLTSNVKFLGQVTDISGLLTAVDAGVFCSNSEGSPNSVLEYMAAGLPVAGTDIPAMREVLSLENHSLLARSGDAETLAKNICRIANDDALRQRLGAANHERTNLEFSSRKMCEETFGVIADYLQKESARSIA